MKTKPFLLATAGSTVDGRTIDADMLKEMASSYDPATYAARLNIEHIRGISGDGPFRAYGDVVELSTADVEVNLNGKTETRLGLFGVLDVNDDAKKLNDAGQKLYPSIEIEPNFGGKNFAYLMGCALTDSPASIATERLQFNRSAPGALSVAGDAAAALEFAEEAAAGGAGLLTAMQSMFDKFTAKFAAADDKPADKPEPAAATALTAADVVDLLDGVGKNFAAALNSAQAETRSSIDALSVKVKALADAAEGAPANNFTARPRSTGAATGANYSGVF